MAVHECRRGLRHPPASIAVMMLVAAVILMNANCGGAAVLVRSNDTYNGCITGRDEACLIAEDFELEWLMEYSSHVTRVLATADPDLVTQDANGGTNVPCKTGKGNKYNCAAKENPKPKPKCKSKFDRTPGCV